MLFKTCGWLTSSYARHISTNVNRRLFNQIPNQDPSMKRKIKTTLNYVTAVGVLTVGLTYAAVPLYRMFCQVFKNSILIVS